MARRSLLNNRLLFLACRHGSHPRAGFLLPDTPPLGIMKRQCQKTMTLGSAALAAALFAVIAKVQEQASQDRNVRISETQHGPSSSSAPVPRETGVSEAASDQPRRANAHAASGSTVPVSPVLAGHPSRVGPERTRGTRKTLDREMAKSPSAGPGELAGLKDDQELTDTASGEDSFVPPPGPVIEEARLPVAVAAPETNDNELTETEREVIGKHTEEFQKAIDSVSHLDEADPAYFDAWKTAQRRRDEQLRLTLGWERFNRLSASAAANVTEVP